MTTSESNGRVKEDSKSKYTKNENLKSPPTTRNMRDKSETASKSIV